MRQAIIKHAVSMIPPLIHSGYNDFSDFIITGATVCNSDFMRFSIFLYVAVASLIKT